MTVVNAFVRAVAFSALLISSPLSAVTFFTDEATFRAAAPGAGNSDFSEVGETPFVDAIDFTVDDVNFRSIPENFVIDGSVTSDYGGVFYYSSASPLTEISSLTFGFRAFGMVYGSTLDTSSAITFTLSDGSIFNTTLPSTAGSTAFFGFTSDTPISSFTVANTGEVFDIISFSSAIPEPATWAMFILGLGLIGSMMRRRRGMIGRLTLGSGLGATAGS